MNKKTDDFKFVTVDGVVYVDVDSVMRCLGEINKSIAAEGFYQEVMKEGRKLAKGGDLE